MENNVQKAEGVGESYLLPGGGLVENFPPIPLKEERIANDEKIRAYLNSITKGVTVTVEVGQLEHFLFKFIDERDFLFLQHLTSATRAAEERKEREILKMVDDLQDKPSGSFAFIDGYDEALNDVHNLIEAMLPPAKKVGSPFLPPPPDKPTE